MKRDLNFLAETNDYTCVCVSNESVNPKNAKDAIVGFESIEVAEDFAYENNLSLVVLSKRTNSNVYSRHGYSKQIDVVDYADENDIFSADDDIAYRLTNELEELDNMTRSLSRLLKLYSEIAELAEDLDDDNLILVDRTLNTASLVDRYPMEYDDESDCTTYVVGVMEL